MIELMIDYLKRFLDGQISYKEFSQTMDIMLHLVDDINNALDSSCLLSVTDDSLVRGSATPSGNSESL